MRTSRDRGNRVRAEHAVCGGLPPSFAYWFRSTVIQTHHFCCWFRSMATSGARTSFMALHCLASQVKPFSRVPPLGIKTQLHLIHSFVFLSVKASCHPWAIYMDSRHFSLLVVDHPPKAPRSHKSPFHCHLLGDPEQLSSNKQAWLRRARLR